MLPPPSSQGHRREGKGEQGGVGHLVSHCSGSLSLQSSSEGLLSRGYSPQGWDYHPSEGQGGSTESLQGLPAEPDSGLRSGLSLCSDPRGCTVSVTPAPQKGGRSSRCGDSWPGAGGLPARSCKLNQIHRNGMRARPCPRVRENLLPPSWTWLCFCVMCTLCVYVCPRVHVCARVHTCTCVNSGSICSK